MTSKPTSDSYGAEWHEMMGAASLIGEKRRLGYVLQFSLVCMERIQVEGTVECHARHWRSDLIGLFLTEHFGSFQGVQRWKRGEESHPPI